MKRRKNWQRLFQRRYSPCGRKGRRGHRTGRQVGKGPGQSHWWLLLSSPVGAEAEAVPRADGSPVAAEVWQGSFLWPQFGSNSDTPWASAGGGLADMFSHFRAPVRRMRVDKPRQQVPPRSPWTSARAPAAPAGWPERAQRVSRAQKWLVQMPG